MTADDAHDPVETISTLPVHLAVVTDAADAAAVVAHIASARGVRVPLVAIVSADLGAELGAVLGGLSPVIAEVISVDALTTPAARGQDTARHALEGLGLGQDFVFTVPGLDDAIVYARARVEPGDEAHWEGKAVLVVGPAPFIHAARAQLT